METETRGYIRDNRIETDTPNLTLLSSGDSTREFWRTFYHDGRNYRVVQQDFAPVGMKFKLDDFCEAYDRAVKFARDYPELPVLHVEYYT